jgi:hypothetical protein
MLGQVGGTRRGKKTMIVQKSQATQLAMIAGAILLFMVSVVGYQMWSLSWTRSKSRADIEEIKYEEEAAMLNMGVDFEAQLQHEMHVAEQATALKLRVLESVGGIDLIVQKVVSDALPLASESQQRSDLLAKMRPLISRSVDRIKTSLMEFESSVVLAAKNARTVEGDYLRQMEDTYGDLPREGEASGRKKRTKKTPLKGTLTRIFAYADKFTKKYQDREIHHKPGEFAKYELAMLDVERLAQEYDAGLERESGLTSNPEAAVKHLNQMMYDSFFNTIDFSPFTNPPQRQDVEVDQISTTLHDFLFYAGLEEFRKAIPDIQQKWESGAIDDVMAMMNLRNVVGNKGSAAYKGLHGVYRNPFQKFTRSMWEDEKLHISAGQ